MSTRVRTFSQGLLAVATFATVVFLWEKTFVAFVLLAATSVLILALERDKRSVYLYVSAFLLGTLSEVAAIYSGAWSYANPHILGVPMWLPFVWGNTAVYFKNVYLVITHFTRQNESL